MIDGSSSTTRTLRFSPVIDVMDTSHLHQVDNSLPCGSRVVL